MRDRAWYVITSAAHDEKALDAVDGKLLIGGKRDEGRAQTSTARSPFAVALVKALRGEGGSPVAGKEAPTGHHRNHVHRQPLRRVGREGRAASRVPLILPLAHARGQQGRVRLPQLPRRRSGWSGSSR